MRDTRFATEPICCCCHFAAGTTPSSPKVSGTAASMNIHTRELVSSPITVYAAPAYHMETTSKPDLQTLGDLHHCSGNGASIILVCFRSRKLPPVQSSSTAPRTALRHSSRMCGTKRPPATSCLSSKCTSIRKQGLISSSGLLKRSRTLPFSIFPL